ncbi:MAG: T9SS type A sorting domain-containing protein [Cytophagales bacterium]|nr:T9SS type A sorting domain-containing protein [Cytophagales bacterium]
MKTLIFYLLFFLFPYLSIAQSDTVVVNWIFGWGEICDGPNGSFACSDGATGDWNNGIKEFLDPIPTGKKVTKIEVTVYKVDCGLSKLTVELNGQIVSTECCIGPCMGLPGECRPSTHIRYTPDGFPGYQYGDTNMIQLIHDTPYVCVDEAEIIIYYQDTTITTVIDTPEIWMVTVDTSTNKNEIIWDKGVYTAQSYTIYKETSPNQYDSIGNIPYSANSVFTDNNSTPDNQSERYKIALVDSFNNTLPLSNFHETIHLTGTMNGTTANLTWTPYQGFTVTSYRIWRGASSQIMTLVGSVLSNITSYTDLSGDSCYLIETIRYMNCSQNSSVLNYNSSKSNLLCITDTGTTGVGLLPSRNINVLIKAQGSTIVITVDGVQQQLFLTLHNLLGKQIAARQSINHNRFVIDTDEFPFGIYFYKLHTEKTFVDAGKFIIR